MITITSPKSRYLTDSEFTISFETSSSGGLYNTTVLVRKKGDTTWTSVTSTGNNSTSFSISSNYLRGSSSDGVLPLKDFVEYEYMIKCYFAGHSDDQTATWYDTSYPYSFVLKPAEYGKLKATTSSSTKVLAPIFSSDTNIDEDTEKVMISTSDGDKFIPLVDSSSPIASSIKVKTESGIKRAGADSGTFSYSTYLEPRYGQVSVNYYNPYYSYGSYYGYGTKGYYKLQYSSYDNYSAYYKYYYKLNYETKHDLLSQTNYTNTQHSATGYNTSTSSQNYSYISSYTTTYYIPYQVYQNAYVYYYNYTGYGVLYTKGGGGAYISGSTSAGPTWTSYSYSYKGYFPYYFNVYGAAKYVSYYTYGAVYYYYTAGYNSTKAYGTYYWNTSFSNIPWIAYYTGYGPSWYYAKYYYYYVNTAYFSTRPVYNKSTTANYSYSTYYYYTTTSFTYYYYTTSSSLSYYYNTYYSKYYTTPTYYAGTYVSSTTPAKYYYAYYYYYTIYYYTYYAGSTKTNYQYYYNVA